MNDTNLPDDPDREYRSDVIINSLGEHREQYFNAISPPVVQTSNFAFSKIDELRKAFEDEYNHLVYSRGRNPTTDILRQKLAALDGAEDCLLFNCGAAAIFAAVLAHVKAGDHIISVRRPYIWAQNTFDRIFLRFNITTTYVEGKSVEEFEAVALPNTRVVYLESPNSWDYGIQDLKAIAKWAQKRSIVTICDNSYCTPVYQQPIKAGIDMVVQSATKYIGGHSDTLGGVLTGSHYRMRNIFNNEFLSIGSGMSPYNAWLMLRGLRTLSVRLHAISLTTEKVINFLKAQTKIEEVIYPFNPEFPQFALAKRQMSGAGGLFTVVLKADSISQITRFCESLKHFLMAVSWGGYESLILPRCASLDPLGFHLDDKEYRKIRFYIGLEDADTLITDIGQALEKL